MKKSSFLILLAAFVVVGCGHNKEPEVKIPPSIPKTPIYSGVLRSTDGGRNFEPRNVIVDEKTTLEARDILSLAVSHFDTNVMYIGTSRGGMYSTQDAGETWVKMNFAPTDINVIALNPQEPKTIYATAVWESRGNVFRSDDNGITWRSIYIEPVQNTQVKTLAFAPNDPRTIYLGTTKNEKGFATLARSVNGGETWENVLTQKNTIDHVAFDAEDAATIYVSGESFGLLKTRDGGTTWEPLRKIKRTKEQEYFQGSVQSFVTHPRDRGVLYAGTDRGFYQTRDYGVAWTEIDIIGTSKGLPIRAVAVNPGDSSRLIYAAAQAVYGKVGGAWAITDTQSKRHVSSLTYDPFDSEIIYMTFTKEKD